MRRPSRLVLLAVLALAAPALVGPPGAGPAHGQQRKIKRLPETWQRWLDEVEYLITKPELRAFLELEKDYQREAFVRRFWEARDPDPLVPGNPFKERYYALIEEASALFEWASDERRRVYVLNGEPGEIWETTCGDLTWPLEFWRYGYSPHTGGRLTMVFYRQLDSGPAKLWRPADGYDVLLTRLGRPAGTQDEQRVRFFNLLRKQCTEVVHDVWRMIQEFLEIEREGVMGPVRAERPPEVPDPEWLQTFQAFSTDAPEQATPLAATLEVTYPGPYQQRVIVAGQLAVEPDGAKPARVADLASYHFLLNGEVLREDELFESFRYRFDLPAPEAAAGEPLPLVFERHLRPGSYRMIVKLEDIHGGGVFREERDLEVPHLGAAAPPAVGGPELAPEDDAPAPGEIAIELLAEAEEVQSGMSRFAARVTGGEPDKVRFYLDDRPVLTKTRPPYSVELNLGTLPVSHTVRVRALDREGNELATDEILVNPGRHSFVVRLVEPEAGKSYDGEMRVRAEVEAPEGKLVERVEIFLNETRMASLYQPPFVQPIRVEGGGAAYVRAVAYLDDGMSSEDLVLFNTGQFLEDVQVRLVELYATVRDKSGRALRDLARDEFRVREDGADQELLRFERVDDLPIYLAMLVDTSASMTDLLPEVRRVALQFVDEGLEARDRAAVITFDEQPRLAAGFTADSREVAGALGGLTAGRGTALWDSVLFGLYYFKGIKGQKALLVLSDGQDRRSKTGFEEVLRFAQSSGVTVYSLVMSGKKPGGGAGKLGRLAKESGGQAFPVTTAADLAGIYRAIGQDLRSRYLLAYQAPPGSGEGFRLVDVRVTRPGAEVRAPRGYVAQ